MGKVLIITVLLSCFLVDSGLAQDFTEAEMKKLTLERTQELGNHIVTIANKHISRELRMNTINTALHLFSSPSTNIVEISSLNTGGIRTRTIRQYLNDLMVLPYRKVEITWFNIDLVSNFVQDPDGAWNAVVKVYQEFKGYDAEGNMIYSDITEKTIAVKITNIEVNSQHRIQVFLSDIKVVETREG